MNRTTQRKEFTLSLILANLPSLYYFITTGMPVYRQLDKIKILDINQFLKS